MEFSEILREGSRVLTLLVAPTLLVVAAALVVDGLSVVLGLKDSTLNFGVRVLALAAVLLMTGSQMVEALSNLTIMALSHQGIRQMILSLALLSFGIWLLTGIDPSYSLLLSPYIAIIALSAGAAGLACNFFEGAASTRLPKSLALLLSVLAGYRGTLFFFENPGFSSGILSVHVVARLITLAAQISCTVLVILLACELPLRWRVAAAGKERTPTLDAIRPLGGVLVLTLFASFFEQQWMSALLIWIGK